MRKFLLIAITLAGCASGSGGEPEVAVNDGPTPVPAPSVYALIGDRERLGLSSAQVVALDSIGEWLSEANSRLEDQLQEMGVTTTGFGGQRRDRVPEEAEPLLANIRANNSQALASIGTLLNEEQEQQLCDDAEEDNERRPGARNPPRGEPRDSTAAPSRPAWPWCGPAESR
jgi:hypothetical protein